MNSNHPIISVITIVKDGESTLSEAVDSILGQDFSDIEYIIVNDGSSDGTADVIDRCVAMDSRVVPIHMVENIGRAGARNRGLCEATGRYIIYLDADDILTDGVLTLLHDSAEADQADIVYGRTRSCEQTTGELRPWHYTDDIVNVPLRRIRMDDHLPLAENHQVVGRLYRRSFIDQFDIRFSDQRRNAEDVPFAFLTAFHARSITLLPELFVYEYRFGNLTATTTPEKVRDAQAAVLETIRYARRHGTPELQRVMWRKGAIFAGNLDRAKNAFGEDESAFWSFVQSMAPLVEGIDDNMRASLPAYYRDLASLYQSGDLQSITNFLTWSWAATERIQLAEELLTVLPSRYDRLAEDYRCLPLLTRLVNRVRNFHDVSGVEPGAGVSTDGQSDLGNRMLSPHILEALGSGNAEQVVDWARNRIPQITPSKQFDHVNRLKQRLQECNSRVDEELARFVQLVGMFPERS